MNRPTLSVAQVEELLAQERAKAFEEVLQAQRSQLIGERKLWERLVCFFLFVLALMNYKVLLALWLQAARGWPMMYD